jgi:3-oxoacyl-[acyl-carrier-protein] synthase III
VAYIEALAYHLPDTVVTNEELQAENVDWDVPRIQAKIGIRQRHLARTDECASDLAFKAAQKLFDRTDVDRSTIDVLLFCTQSPDYHLPATACILQERLGLPTSVAAFDFNQGCSGFVYGLFLAKCMIASGEVRRVLLLTADTYSKYIHPRDRSVRLLFGDAGAAVLIAADSRGAKIGEVCLGTDGAGAQNLIVPAGGARKRICDESTKELTDENGSTRTENNLFMDGQEVFAFTLKRVPQLVDEILRKGNLTREDINWYIFHQANRFMNEQLCTKLKIPKERAPVVIETIGNTVSSTIPITLRESADKFRPGDRLLLVGFGVGYSWGACNLIWDDTTQLL